MGPRNSHPEFSVEPLKGMELEKDLERIQGFSGRAFPSVSSRIQELPIPRTFGSLPTPPSLGFLGSPGADSLELLQPGEEKPRQAEELKGIKVKIPQRNSQLVPVLRAVLGVCESQKEFVGVGKPERGNCPGIRL